MIGIVFWPCMVDFHLEMADTVSKRNRTVQKAPKNKKGSHKLIKRPAIKQEQAENVIYVNSKSNTKHLLDNCSKLIHKETPEIIIYCLGAAIARGILLALQVCERHPAYQISAKTYTTEVTDDLEPATDDVDYEIQKRQNSALRIVVKNIL